MLSTYANGLFGRKWVEIARDAWAICRLCSLSTMLTLIGDIKLRSAQAVYEINEQQISMLPRNVQMNGIRCLNQRPSQLVDWQLPVLNVYGTTHRLEIDVGAPLVYGS